MSLPLPDQIITNGPFHHKILEESGYPPNMITNGGSWRYPLRFPIEKPPSKSVNQGSVVLVPLPADSHIAREIMSLLIKYADVWLKHRIRFLIKTHPQTPFDRVGRYPEEGRSLESTTMSMEVASTQVDGVLYCSTTVGLEAVLMGIPAIAYLPEGRICLDPAMDWFPTLVHSCSAEDFYDRILGVLREDSRTMHAPRWHEVWGPIDEQCWLDLARRRKDRSGFSCVA